MEEMDDNVVDWCQTDVNTIKFFVELFMLEVDFSDNRVVSSISDNTDGNIEVSVCINN